MRSSKRRSSRLILTACLLLLLLAPAAGLRAEIGVAVPGAMDAAATLSLAQVVVPPGVDVVLDLKLTSNPGAVRGVDIVLAYTPGVVELRSVTKGSLAADWLLMSNVHANGQVEIALAGVTPPGGDVVLAHLTFRGLGQKGQTTAVAFVQAQVNEADALGSAQSGRITLDTQPVTDLRAAVVTGAIHLTWTHVGSDAHHYEVWRATNLPYFTPQGVPLAPNVAPGAGPSFDDTNSGIGNTATNSFYLVRSVDAAGWPAPTYNRVGVFNFGLTPGGQ